MIKKILLTVIGVLLFTMAYSQGQEDHVVRRGRYKAAVTKEIEKEPINWYNEISLSGFYGSYGTAEVTGIYENHIALASPKRLYDAVTATLGYNRLARFGNFFIGPGLNARYGTSGLWGADLFAHARLQILTGKVHLYLNGSAGLSYWDLTLKDAQNYEFVNNYTNGTNEIYGGKLSGDHHDSGIRFYFDFGAGFSFDMGKHSALSIGYHATLLPYVHSYLNIDEGDILDIYYNSFDYSTHQVELHHEGTAWGLLHGLKISFMF